jgi:RsiW-degrading membrane proteinase PrsW (M82 family)
MGERDELGGGAQVAGGRRSHATRHLLTATCHLLWQFAIPGAILLLFAYRDRYDGKPPYVIPWFLFAAIVGAAWTAPLLMQPPRHHRFRFAIPMWIWPWLAVAGVLVHRV